MKSIKYLVVLACMTFGLANVAKAQIYNDEVCFYVKAGYDDSTITVVKFEGTEMKVMVSLKGSSLKEKLAINERYYEDVCKWKEGIGTYKYYYDPQKSTSSREVYKHTLNYGYISNTTFYAFSEDLSSLIIWCAGSEDNRSYFTRILKEDLIPEKTIPDFIYE